MKHLILISLIIFTFASCSKNNSDIPAQPSKKLVKITQEFGSNTNYKYDEQGRLTEVKSGDQLMSFQYGGNQVVMKMIVMSLNHTAMEITFDLNEKGLAASGSGVMQGTPNMPVQNVQVTNIFNDQGYLIEQKMNGNAFSSNTEYTWTGGNLTQAKTFSNNVYSYTQRYYYTSQTPDKTKPGGGEMGSFPGITIFGKGNVHLADKNEFYDNLGNLTSTNIITYNLDTDGFPAQRKVVSGANVSNSQYHYE